MAVIHKHWYDLNTARQFPLADQATTMSQAGARLPSDIIADLNVRYPSTLGQYPFVAAVSVTANLVTVVLQVVNDLDDTTSLAPLAVISIPKPISQGRHYAITGQVPGVGGWIVFGNGVTGAYAGSFLPRAGLLAPRAARPYRPLPVKSLGVLHTASPLTGIVRLRGEAPIQIVGDEREIDGILRAVAVIQLVQQQSSSGTTTNVFSDFAGPCSARPDTGNCPDPQPIEYLNAVQPDCDGNLTIEFRGCATLGSVVGNSGVILDCGLGLKDACIDNHLPASDGKLRTEYPDECSSISASESKGDDGGDAGPGDDSGSDDFMPGSQSLMTLGELPYVERFINAHYPAYWATPSGSFAFSDDVSPTAPAADPLVLHYGAEQKPLQAVTTVTSTSSDSVNTYNIGYRFTANVAGHVTKLWTKMPDTASHTISLFDAGGSLIASTTVTGVAGTWVSGDISPVALTAGGTYTVAVRTTLGWYEQGGVAPVASGDISIVTGCYRINSSLVPDTNATGGYIYAADISFEPLTASTPYSYTTEGSASALNLAAWEGWDTSSLSRQYQTDVKLLDGGTKHVAGLMFNYRPHTTYPARRVYFVATIDYELQRFELFRSNGVGLVSTGVWASLTNLQRNRWYRISVTTAPGTGDNVDITATLTALEGPTMTATIGPLSTSMYLPDTGFPGFYADRTAARFSDLSVEEV